VESLRAGHRPFELRAARLDEEADPDEKSAWWSRHGHDRQTALPDTYRPDTRARIEARLAAIEEDPRLQLLESFPFKRRWQLPELGGEGWPLTGSRKTRNETQKAAEAWLLDRLEDLFAPKAEAGTELTAHAQAGALSQPRPYRLEEVLAAFLRDPRVAAVAGVHTGEGSAVDLSHTVEALLRAHGLPDNPRRIYTEAGRRKRDEWKRVWALQDQEDQGATALSDPETGAPLLDEEGEPLRHPPVPPKYDKGDFQADYFSTRGKLDVPRERFILFADLLPPCYGWNGWRDNDRADAQLDALSIAERYPENPLPPPTAEDPRLCGPMLGLWETLPDVRRWAPTQEPGLRSVAEGVCRQPACPCPLVERWEAWRSGKAALGEVGRTAATAVTIEERAAAMALFEAAQASLPGLGAAPKPRGKGAGAGKPIEALRKLWRGAPDRLEPVLDDLLATGELSLNGRGEKRVFAAAGRG
jgi:hypothetical protein